MTDQLTPTPEQDAIRALFSTGESLAIEAGAGTGKTATLKMLAEDAPEKRIQYVAFNRKTLVGMVRKIAPTSRRPAKSPMGAKSLRCCAIGSTKIRPFPARTLWRG